MLNDLIAKISPLSLVSQSFPPAAQWTADDMPDQTGKVAVVTGANAGVGYHTALALLRKGAKVYVAARSEDKAKVAIAKMTGEAGGKQASFLKLDLGDLPAIKKAADELKSKEKQVDILIANAGVMVPPIEQVTAQGYDLQYGTNVLGHAYLINECISLLKASATATGHKARVCITSSSAHHFMPSKIPDGIAWDTLEGADNAARKKMGKETLYAQSKLSNVILTQAYQRRYADSITFASCNPGNLKSELQRHLSGIVAMIVNSILYPPHMGALNQLYLTTMPEAENMGGKYFVPWCRDGDACVDKRAYNPEVQDKLMKWVDEQVAKHVA